MNYQEILSDYNSRREAVMKNRRSIERRMSILERKLKWNHKQWLKLETPSWIDFIVFPFLEEVNKLLSEFVVKGEKVTFGLNCQTPVHVTKDGETVFFSYLEPAKDGLKYQTQKVIRECSYGNDYETKPVESVEQYAAYIKECIDNYLKTV